MLAYAVGAVLVTLTVVMFAAQGCDTGAQGGAGAAGSARSSANATPSASVTATAAAAGTGPVEPAPAPARHAGPALFDVRRAMTHVRHLSVDIGRRVGGTDGEYAAIEYAAAEFKKSGYDVRILPVPLSDGRLSHDVVAFHAGAAGPVVVVGGHVDTKGEARGADDNATGCGVVLELARDFASAPPADADLRFVLFGHEELIGDGDSNHHHFGSRTYVKRLSAAERKRFAAALSVDMVGYGSDFCVRTMGEGTRAVADRLLATSRIAGAPLQYRRDPGSSGWSDHEPFERAGLPAAWLEWTDDPAIHTSRDTYGRLDPAKVKSTGCLVQTWLAKLTKADLEALVRTR